MYGVKVINQVLKAKWF